jgi:hypothetical protein
MDRQPPRPRAHPSARAEQSAGADHREPGGFLAGHLSKIETATAAQISKTRVALIYIRWRLQSLIFAELMLAIFFVGAGDCFRAFPLDGERLDRGAWAQDVRAGVDLISSF